jgi:hypothetical protein
MQLKHANTILLLTYEIGEKLRCDREENNPK